MLNPARDYYDDKLAAERLLRAYEIAPPRVRQYLNAEAEHVLSHIQPGDSVLELGCGYGRIMRRLAEKAGRVVGIDTSESSLELGRKLLADVPNCELLQMNAVAMSFPSAWFDVVACIQNGISAFHVDHEELLREGIRVCRKGGVALFSSYSEKFWEHRLEWFRMQADAGLLGEIDDDKTGDGVIVCKDGFTGTTVKPEELRALASAIGVRARIVEVDDSSLFCELTP